MGLVIRQRLQCDYRVTFTEDEIANAGAYYNHTKVATRIEPATSPASRAARIRHRSDEAP